MNETTEPHTDRKIEKELRIDASPDDVWKALTEAEELVRWFPLQAEVEPGVGGHIRLMWGDVEGGNARIESWEPGRRLVVSTPFPLDEGVAHVGTEYLLEPDGEGTRMRLVQFGFGDGDSWDTMYDGIHRGWDFELRGLKHYLENHRGKNRRVVHQFAEIHEPIESAWDKITGDGGLDAKGALGAPAEGDAVRLETSDGFALEGTVAIFGPPRDFAVFLSSLGDSYLRVRVDRSCAVPGTFEANLWLSTYELDDASFERAEASFRKILDGLFPKPA